MRLRHSFSSRAHHSEVWLTSVPNFLGGLHVHRFNLLTKGDGHAYRAPRRPLKKLVSCSNYFLMPMQHKCGASPCFQGMIPPFDASCVRSNLLRTMSTCSGCFRLLRSFGDGPRGSFKCASPLRSTLDFSMHYLEISYHTPYTQYSFGGIFSKGSLFGLYGCITMPTDSLCQHF